MNNLAERYLQEGNLAFARTELQNQIKKAPANAKLRVFLFQLLAVLGEWDRALAQLNVSGDLDAANLAMVQTYREAIRCEVLRKDIFQGNKTPLLFGEPTQWLALLQQALKLTAGGEHSQAQQLRDEAFAQAPATRGVINSEAFDWIADADTRLGPVLEAIINGHYYWIPFHCIAEIQLEAPADLRDLVWMPAHFMWNNGNDAVGLIPTRYPQSEISTDTAICLARKTDWQIINDTSCLGLGQRLLSTDLNDYALMDIREVKLNTELG
jgi:type VI secretion system protein ImpE